MENIFDRIMNSFWELFDFSESTISTPDTIIIIAYLIGIMVIGILAGYKKNTSSDQFFLAGRSLKWPVIGTGLFCANISTIHLVGLAASGYDNGLVIGNFEWMAGFCLILLGIVFAPFYFRNKISTLPEYIEKRYGEGPRMFLAFIFIMSALLVHIGISLFAGAQVLESFFGIPYMLSIIVIAVITAIYTVLGGLKAVMVTDAIQAVLLLAGAATLTGFGLYELHEQGITSWAALMDAVKPGQMDMIQPIKMSQEAIVQAGEVATRAAAKLSAETGKIVEPVAPLFHLREYSWFSILLGYPVLGIWYWCTDQTIVQKILSAKSEKDGRDGAIFAGFLKILPVFLMVLPGVIAYALYHDKGLIDPEKPNGTLMVMMQQLLPVGIKGLMAAGLLAALMSTIEAALNSTATLMSEDIVKRIKPNLPDATLVLIGRITAIVVVILAMAWSTQGEKFDNIFEAINKIPMAFAPGITAIFLWGVFWPRGNKQAAMTTLVFNVVIGFIYLAVDIPMFGKRQLVAEVVGIPFMQVGFYLFVLSSIVYFAVSLATPAPPKEKTENLCWTRPMDALRGKMEGTITDPRVMAAILFVIMAVLYILLG